MSLQTSRIVAGCLGVATLLLGRGALAVPEYPRAITSQLQLDYEPPCSVCHLANNTGVGTVTTPFGYSMRAAGLTGDDRNSVVSALAQLKSDATDSDGDGVSDTDELIAGNDPNSKSSTSIRNAPTADYGCGVAHSRVHGTSGFGLLLAAAGLLLGRRSRAPLR